MSTVQEDVKELSNRVNVLEDEFTLSLGFTIPEKLSVGEAFQLLTVVQDPLRTEIKTKILTRDYALSDYDVRWIMLGVLIRFGMRFGKMREVAMSIATDFYDVMDKTASRVHDLMAEEGRIPATRFSHFRGCVEAFICATTEWDERRLKLMTKENFVMYNNAEYKNKNLINGLDETFSSLTNSISIAADNYCRKTSGQPNLPDIVRNLSWCDGPEDLRNFKEQLKLRVRAVQIFNEILDDF